ncbi:MAG: CHAT domain-containing protein [Anaerolineae bacterium]|nr:CHAT domain-containing protein [Anaerolineae bacterium]
MAEMNPNAIVLSYYIQENNIIAFISAAGKMNVTRDICKLSEVQASLLRLAKQWSRFSTGRAFAERNMTQLEQVTREMLKELYDVLFHPLNALLREALDAVINGEDVVPPKLVVVPHGPLHQVPFHALFDGECYLLERFEISYAPSATKLVVCDQRTGPPSIRALIYGVADADTPSADAEARAIAERVEDAVLRTGEQATLALFKQESPGRDVLHLACHGLFRVDNPMFSALKLADGWLMARDVMALNLEGALVTLSACDCGRSRAVGGDEILGLTRAFLSAGASSLVVSLWLAATGGAYAQSYGIELHNNLMPASGGMGGASIAKPQDFLSAINGNPGALADFSGTHFTFGGAWAEPTYNIDQLDPLPLVNVDPFSAKSGTPGAAAGNIGVSQELSLNGLPAVFGLGFLTNAGAGVDFRGVPASNGGTS